MAPKPELQFIRACSTGKTEVVRELLQGGLSADTCDTFGLTGLMWAGRKGQVQIANVLHAGGADLEAKDRRGRTALFHAVAYKCHVFVEFLLAKGAMHSPVDAHGWTPLDVASMPTNREMVEILKQSGAERRYSQEPPVRVQLRSNSFYFGPAVGGPNLPVEVERIHIQLGLAMSRWTGNYTDAIETFSFSPFVDGSVVRYTERMNILGVQKAKRKRDWLDVEIGVPESWWREEEPKYKRRLTDSMQEGLHSMIALLVRNKHGVNAELLLADWAKLRKEFLEISAPPFAAEKQRVATRSLMNEVLRGN
jgi:Ankyrin repeats (3 copies)